MVVWIVAIGCAYGIVAKWLELRTAKRLSDEDSETTLAKLEALEERIAIMESALAVKPNRWYSHLFLAREYREAGFKEKANHHFEQESLLRYKRPF